MGIFVLKIMRLTMIIPETVRAMGAETGITRLLRTKNPLRGSLAR
jgi:hypothetical protein